MEVCYRDKEQLELEDQRHGLINHVIERRRGLQDCVGDTKMEKYLRTKSESISSLSASETISTVPVIL